MEIYKKLQKCRLEIKSTKLQKAGHNNFSKYVYFTSSQVEQLVFDVCNKYNLFCHFDLVRTELGLIGRLTIHDLDTESDRCHFEMATDIPEIKATNITQQLGGTMTYTERYLKMTAFGIVDNTLDFDSQDNTEKKGTNPKVEKKEDNKEWLNPNTENYNKVLNAMIDGYTIDQVRQKYKVSKEVAQSLQDDIQDFIDSQTLK